MCASFFNLNHFLLICDFFVFQVHNSILKYECLFLVNASKAKKDLVQDDNEDMVPPEKLLLLGMSIKYFYCY